VSGSGSSPASYFFAAVFLAGASFAVLLAGAFLPNVSSAQLVQYVRTTCDMLRTGVTTGYVVSDLANHHAPCRSPIM
jgi:peroxiredoxin